MKERILITDPNDDEDDSPESYSVGCLIGEEDDWEYEKLYDEN